MSNKQVKTQTKTVVSKSSGQQPSSRAAKKTKKPRRKGQQPSVAYMAKSTIQVSKGNPKGALMRTGMKSELLFTIPASTSSDFTVVRRVRINPQSLATFKTLPSIAQNFESFRFHYLRIRYENRCSSTIPGSIVLSPSYDASDSDAQAATEALLYENKGTTDASVWKSHSMVLSPASMNRLYKSHTCMSDERFANTKQDLKTIDPAQVFIALDGVTANLTTGKIFIDYDVEFFEPHSPTEPINQGGFAQKIVQSFSAGNNKPFTVIPSAGNIAQETVPIFKDLASLVNENVVTFPTAAVGQIIKDYSGMITTLVTGSGLSSYDQLYVSSNPNSLADDPGNLQIFPKNVTSSGAQTSQYWDVVLKAGDFLLSKSGVGNSITGYTMLAAASSAFL